MDAERDEHRHGGRYTTAGKEFVRDTRYITTASPGTGKAAIPSNRAGTV